ncbi:MAG: hypothetical protein ACFFC1_02025 [Promethearchaeota archaeon]
MLIGFAGFIFSQVGIVLTPFLADFLIQGTYVDYNFYGVYFYGEDFNTINPSLYAVFIRIRNFWYTLGSIFIFFTFEKIIKRTKYILTTSYTAILILILILPYELAYLLFVYGVAVVSGFIVYFIFFLYTKWSRMEFKAITAFFSFALILLVVGHNLTSNVIRSYFGELIIPRIVYLYAGPIFSLIGFLIMLIPAIANPNIIRYAFRYWIIFGIGIGIVAGLNLFNAFEIGYIEMAINYFIVFGFYLVVFYKIIKNVRAEIRTEKPEQDILKMFSRPQEIHIKDITYSKEYKVCLVCKGNLSKLNIFKCSKCAVLYCQNCAGTLETLENACWVCNAPFNKKKPSKPYKIELDEDKIMLTDDFLQKNDQKLIKSNN